MNTQSTPQQLIKLGEAARLVDVHRCTLWRWARRGKFPAPVLLHGETRFRADEVAAWINDLPRRQPSAVEAQTSKDGEGDGARS